MKKGSLCSWHQPPDALRAMDLEGSSLYQLLVVTRGWAGAATAWLHVARMINPCVCWEYWREQHVLSLVL